MTVWRLTPDRAAEWREIRLEALQLAPRAYTSRLADWQHRPLADFAARLAQTHCFASGLTIGQPLATAGWHAEAGPAPLAWITGVYSRPLARGRGYARDVMSAAIADAWASGMAVIGLSVYAGLPAPRALYESLGFRPGPSPVPTAEPPDPAQIRMYLARV